MAVGSSARVAEMAAASGLACNPSSSPGPFPPPEPPARRRPVDCRSDQEVANVSPSPAACPSAASSAARRRPVPCCSVFASTKTKTTLTRMEVFRTGVDEVHEPGTAVELGKEDSGVGL